MQLSRGALDCDRPCTTHNPSTTEAILLLCTPATYIPASAMFLHTNKLVDIFRKVEFEEFLAMIKRPSSGGGESSPRRIAGVIYPRVSLCP